MYFNGMFNIEILDDNAEYAIFDDFMDWTKWYTYKQWLGAQKEFTVTDKYAKKKLFKWGKPCIILSNDAPIFNDYMWIEGNCITCVIKETLFI